MRLRCVKRAVVSRAEDIAGHYREALRYLDLADEPGQPSTTQWASALWAAAQWHLARAQVLEGLARIEGDQVVAAMQARRAAHALETAYSLEKTGQFVNMRTEPLEAYAPTAGVEYWVTFDRGEPVGVLDEAQGRMMLANNAHAVALQGRSVGAWKTIATRGIDTPRVDPGGWPA